MKKFAIMIFALLMIFSAPALAKNVTVTGMGLTATEAENDALRAAVENTMGVLVDSETLVQNSMLISDQIYTQSRAFVNDYTVLSREEVAGGWRVTINATVDDQPNSKLMNELTRLGIINVQLRNPKIAVYVPEQHLNYQVGGAGAETAIVKTLLNAGFNFVTEVGTGLNYQSPMLMNVAQMKAAAEKFGVDIMIVGESFSEGVGDLGDYLPGNQRTNMRACRARVEAKMFIVRTGQVIAADGKYGSAYDNSEAIAAKKALSAAGEQAGNYFVEQITGMYTSRQGVEVVVIGADFSKINLVQSGLAKINRVKNVNLSSYDGGRAVFTVMYGGSPQTLFNELCAVTNADLTLQSLAYNTLTVYVR
ncbi:MAG: hypothetical protein IJL12_00545 [Selenomonadaceae bacterium]|nr:hypothetical protein [Selenomonadaceae bacterium]MBQ6130824.1 hypothetical protein [Selenomonadaceae bacterium]